MNCRLAPLVVLLAVVAAVGAATGPRAAMAQPAPGPAAAAGEPAPDGAPTAPAARRPKPAAPAGQGGIIRLDEEVIEGRIQKPEAFYILQRSNLNYESLELKRSFIPNILESVKKEPF